jgi:4-hydroxy-3-methylbut-2-enyl diphosphate reductase
LVEVARQAGVPAAHRIDHANEVDPIWLDGVSTVGLTSGASVPELLVTQVLERLAVSGFTEVTPVRTVEESTIFSLPREIRP